MAFTNAPAAKAALLTLIQARPNLAGVQMSAGHPGDNIDVNETIFTDSIVATQDWETMGGSTRRRREDFTIELIVIAGKAGVDQAGAEARAWVLLEECELAVRADVTLAATVIFAGITSMKQTNGKGSQGWVSQIVAEVTCRAQVHD